MVYIVYYGSSIVFTTIAIAAYLGMVESSIGCYSKRWQEIYLLNLAFEGRKSTNRIVNYKIFLVQLYYKTFCTVKLKWFDTKLDLLQSKSFIWGLSKYLGFGWLYQKLRALYEGHFSVKKVTETKDYPRPYPENGIFHPLISWVYNNHCAFGIFMSKYQRKKLQPITGSIKVVDFDGLFLTAIFAQ